MGYVEGEDREQVVMFPEVMDDYVSADNPVRFVDAFVRQLEIGTLGFSKAEPSELGRPAYDPRDLLKLYIYGYVNEVRSSRKLERETKRNVELMWLMRRLTPDHKTIANFRSVNRQGLREVFRQFTRLCRELNLYGRELVGIDGSKFRAVNGKDRNFTAAKLSKRLEWIEEKIEKYLRALEATDQAESKEPEVSAAELQEKIKELQARQLRYERMQEQLAASGENQISLTDSEARLMPSRQGQHVSYNVQVAVDSKHKLIADFAVTNEANDVNSLAAVAQSVKQELAVDQLKVCADGGYYSTAQIKACEDEQIDVYMERPRGRQPEGIFPLESFSYEESKDEYVCPAGKRLRYRLTDKSRQLRCYWTEACHQCPLKSQCTTGKGPRKIKRPVHQAAAERMAQRVAQHPEILQLRKQLVEHPFGTIKRWMRQDHFLTRGKAKVSGEASLTFLAYNLKRVIKLIGVTNMIGSLSQSNLQNSLSTC